MMMMNSDDDDMTCSRHSRSQLRISRGKAEDSGRYQCSATNVLGTAISNVTSVNVKPGLFSRDWLSVLSSSSSSSCTSSLSSLWSCLDLDSIDSYKHGILTCGFELKSLSSGIFWSPSCFWVQYFPVYSPVLVKIFFVLQPTKEWNLRLSSWRDLSS